MTDEETMLCPVHNEEIPLDPDGDGYWCSQCYEEAGDYGSGIHTPKEWYREWAEYWRVEEAKQE